MPAFLFGNQETLSIGKHLIFYSFSYNTPILYSTIELLVNAEKFINVLPVPLECFGTENAILACLYTPGVWERQQTLKHTQEHYSLHLANLHATNRLLRFVPSTDSLTSKIVSPVDYMTVMQTSPVVKRVYPCKRR